MPRYDRENQDAVSGQARNRSFEDAARCSITPNLSQKLKGDVFQNSFRASENVCHDGRLPRQFGKGMT